MGVQYFIIYEALDRFVIFVGFLWKEKYDIRKEQ